MSFHVIDAISMMEGANRGALVCMDVYMVWLFDCDACMASFYGRWGAWIQK